MTVKEVKEELKLVRYYYQRKADFDRMKNVVVAPEVTNLVNKYLTAASTCDAKSYMTFCALYIDGDSQETVASKWGYSLVYVRKLNQKLCEYFAEQFNNCAN